MINIDNTCLEILRSRNSIRKLDNQLVKLCASISRQIEHKNRIEQELKNEIQYSIYLKDHLAERKTSK
jgi:hypothetical protein